MRNEERAYLDKLVTGVMHDLDVLLMPDHVEAIRSDIQDIATRCLRALEQKEAA
jgi:hypothetical protein